MYLMNLVFTEDCISTYVSKMLLSGFWCDTCWIATSHFAVPPGRIHSLLAQRLLLGQPVKALTKIVLTTSVMASSLSFKLAVRAISGGKNTLALSNDHWINAGIAGALCGLMFGIRGGLPQAWAAAGICSVGAVMSEFIPPQELTTKNWFGETNNKEGNEDYLDLVRICVRQKIFRTP
ncbi:hypothetical protein Ocin01_17816 [Orchesella cincta]|uniref:Uncharacterized protein n=1 Tax=Orchesella cincta TaxID=48709 RepID=A0A1D2M7C0_ORCCI|nr:hypothetical protein Ocin01_17816 [Orchesella cincta]